MLRRTKEILNECKQVWPLASRWLDRLEKLSRDPKAAGAQMSSMADGVRCPLNCYRCRMENGELTP
jgi:hypothetical protein